MDATATGIPVSGEPKAKWMSKTNEGVSFTGSSEFVFAFQLIKISSRKGGAITEVHFNKGALYEAGGEQEEDKGVKGLHGAWKIAAIDDPADECLGVVVNPAVDKHGEPCNVLSGG